MTSIPRWVRDQQWAVTSPPLIDTAAELQPPRELLDNSGARGYGAAPVTRSGRLGIYFEDLWADWIERHPDYELVDRNLPVREPGRTIGEYDFILQNRNTGHHLHLEVAVKFYMGVGDLTHVGNWFGPNPEDSLAIKVERLLNHQIGLSDHPRSQAELLERNIDIRARAVALRGRLFYPLSGPRALPTRVHPGHLHGYWGLPADWLEACEDPALEWTALPKRLWLSTVARDELEATLPLEQLLASPAFGPQAGSRALVALRDGQEWLRGFLVHEDWMARVAERQVD